MKKFIYILFVAISIVGCQSTTHNLGAQFIVKNPVSVDSVLVLLNSESSIQDVQVEGKINKSCMSEGCWFTIKDVSGNEVLFNITGKKFRVPVNSPGKTVVLLVDKEATLQGFKSKQSPRNELSVKGLLFK